MEVDFIIIGQGICGTFLSWNLIKEGKKVLVIDEANSFSASKVASGVINPVTGRRIVRTWLIEELMPFAWDAYTQISNQVNECLIRECNVLDFHPSSQMQEAFFERLQQEKDYLHKLSDENEWQQYFRYNYGVDEIAPCFLVDLQTLLSGWRKKLQMQELLLEENFDWHSCKISSDHVMYKDVRAKKIICCEGVAGFTNPYFKLLPFAINKGEALIAEIQGLPRTNIFKQGISIVPWQNNLFWIGSTNEWNYKNAEPTSLFRKKVENQLNYWLKLPHKIYDHFAAERPANIERRPFVGLHPFNSSIGILNGMGTKGCSLAPYFANQLTQFLLYNVPVNPLADIKRFTKILNR